LLRAGLHAVTDRFGHGPPSPKIHLYQFDSELTSSRHRFISRNIAAIESRGQRNKSSIEGITMTFRIGLVFVTALLMLQCASLRAEPASPDVQTWRTLFCGANGGRDITSQGKLNVGENVGAVVVCQYPQAAADTASARRAPQVAAPNSIFPSPVTATVHPPAGTFSLAQGNPAPISCSADIAIAATAGLPAVSNGTSTFNCRGYNYGQSSLGCGVQWSGPTAVTIGATPFGGSASVNFTCAILNYGAFSSVMDYTYQDTTYPRLSYSVQGIFGTINFTQ
jgi:hypothetical protein